MVSNYNRKSASSGSRRTSARSRNISSSKKGAARPAASTRHVTSARPAAPVSSKVAPYAHTDTKAYRAIPGGRMPDRRGGYAANPPLTSVRVGDLNRAQRAKRTERVYRRYVIRIGIIVALMAVLAVGGAVLYSSDVFMIESVAVKGVEHLTAEDMQNMAGVPSGTTLLRVDASDIKEKLLQNAWVQDVSVNRVFPDTLELAVTERSIEAVVEVPQENARVTQPWAIASDGMWLMPIPDRNSEAGQKTSAKVYEDAESVLRITDVPYGTKPEIGTYCTDSYVNNALAIVAGMTTELSERVTAVKATEMESTTLTIKDGPDIVFGTAENIREKERVCLEIMKEHPDGVSYINVRTVDRPTWRAL